MQRKAEGAGNPYGKDAPELVLAYSYQVNPFLSESDMIAIAIAPPEQLEEARRLTG